MRQLLLLVLVGCATKTAPSRHPDPSGAVTRCLAASETATQFPAVCSEVWTQPSCREAWVSAAADPTTVGKAQVACHEAYCRVLTPRPVACDRPLAEGWDEIQKAAHVADLGESETHRLGEGMARMAERFRAEAQKPIVIQPAEVPSDPPVNLSVLVGKSHVVLGKTGDDALVFIQRCGKVLDRAALASALCQFAGQADFARRQDIEIAGDAGASYGDLMAVMDAAIAVGLLDVGVVDPPSLSVPLSGKPVVGYLRPACDQTPMPCKPTAAPPPASPSAAPSVGLTMPPAEQKDELRRALIVDIDDIKISLNGAPVAILTEVAALPPGEWKIVGLFEAVRDLPTSLVILQAAPTTDATIINNVLKTLYAADRPNILFTVKGGSSR